MEDRRLLSTVTVLNNFDSGAGSLRAAITAAHSGDTIVFAPSLDGQTITLTSGELLIKQNLTINGPSDRSVTVSGNTTGAGILSRVFEASKAKSIALSGLTISNGLAQSGNGGGILNHGTLTLTNCTLSFNHVTYNVGDPGGGGLYNDVGTVTVSDCTVSDNIATVGGGGLFNDDAGTLTVTNSIISRNTAGGGGGGINNDNTMMLSACTLDSNSASEGGGIVTIGHVTISGCTLSGNSCRGAGGAIANFSAGSRTGTIEGQLTVSGCTLSGNHAGNGGGGIYNWSGTSGWLKVTDACVLSGNSARLGGGIYNYNGTTDVSGSTLSGNTATFEGGGIYIYTYATVTIENASSITGNIATSEGGGIYNNGGTLTVTNSIFNTNTPDNIFGSFTDGLGNIFS